MFCDLVGSTALSTRFDPEDLRELIGDYHRLAAEFHPLGFGVGPAARCAFEDATALQLGGNAEDGEHDLGKVRGRIEVRFCQRTDTGPGALHLAGDNQKVGRVAR